MPPRTEAELIRSLQAKGWTQRQIATAVGRSPSYVSKVAVGKRSGRGLGESLRTLSRRKGPSAKPALAERLAGYRKDKGSAPPPARAPERTPPPSADDTRAGTVEIGSWWDQEGKQHKGSFSREDRPDVRKVTAHFPGIGWRTMPVILTDDYGWADFVSSVYRRYG